MRSKQITSFLPQKSVVILNLQEIKYQIYLRNTLILHCVIMKRNHQWRLRWTLKICWYSIPLLFCVFGSTLNTSFVQEQQLFQSTISLNDLNNKYLKIKPVTNRIWQDLYIERTITWWYSMCVKVPIGSNEPL